MSEQLHIDFTAARIARDDGMARAANHADQVVPSWQERALAFLRDYAASHADFICEDVRQYAEARGLPTPPDGRAWGAVMMRGARLHIVGKTDRVRCAADPKVHMNPCTLWKSCLR
jgi:hypothetical protein